jgi:trimethylguanosine synthase
MIAPIPGEELFELTSNITRNIAFFLPRNTDLHQLSALAPEGETVEVEEAWMGNKLKSLTCYFSGLAVGQEHLF